MLVYSSWIRLLMLLPNELILRFSTGIMLALSIRDETRRIVVWVDA